MTTKTRRSEKRTSKTGDDGYRHEKGCPWSGQTLVRHPLSDRLCCCDPHGTKARAVKVALEKHDRRRVLDQDEIWYPKEGDPVRLDQMSLRWKKNLLAFLERRAPALHASEEWYWMTTAAGHDGGEHAHDALEQIADEVMDTAPMTWLYRTPFVLRLEQLIREEHDGPEDRHDPSKVRPVEATVSDHQDGQPPGWFNPETEQWDSPTPSRLSTEREQS